LYTTRNCRIVKKILKYKTRTDKRGNTKIKIPVQHYEVHQECDMVPAKSTSAMKEEEESSGIETAKGNPRTSVQKRRRITIRISPSPRLNRCFPEVIN